MWKKSGVNCPAENFTRASSLRIDVQGGSYLGLVVWRATVQEKLSWAEFNGSYLSRGGSYPCGIVIEPYIIDNLFETN